MRRGFSVRSDASSPSWRTMPGRRFWITTSASSTMKRRKAARCASFLRSSATECLLRFKVWKITDAPCQKGGPQLRASSPPLGFSIFTTLAPRSPNTWPAKGAATLVPSSTTTIPSSGRAAKRIDSCAGPRQLGRRSRDDRDFAAGRRGGARRRATSRPRRNPRISPTRSPEPTPGSADGRAGDQAPARAGARLSGSR